MAVGLGAMAGVGDAVAGGVGEGAGVKAGVGLGAGVVTGEGLGLGVVAGEGLGFGVGLAAGECGAVARRIQQALVRRARARNVFCGGVVFTIIGNVMGGYEGFGRRSYKSLCGRQA